MSRDSKRIWVAGHRGMVGSAIVRELSQGASEVITVDRTDLDLTDQRAVARYVATQSIDEIYLAAARVGGIHANNTYPADFILDNLLIEANIIKAAHDADVNKLLFLGSSCIYPKNAPQPMPEASLLTGTLEQTNEPYAIAKIAGIKLCESFNRQFGRDYRSVMPTNLYGPGDNFHPTESHVLPALMRRFMDAKQSGDVEVVIWGTGTPRREFLHVDDMAAASVHVMNLDAATYTSATEPMLSHLNVGTGNDCSIRELAELVAATVGYAGALRFDSSKPDGTPRKLLDVSRINSLGWRAQIDLADGIRRTYDWFLSQGVEYRGR
ncbi:GDP-L-fucose synthase [Mycetocola zhadangensis]|uniref:GDP-L-fucose synthase n=1 Tax=Mycetocola zhadangensis TaxID=1164595 RepID=UPI003A4D9295